MNTSTNEKDKINSSTVSNNQNQISNAFSNPPQIEAPQNKNLSTNDDLNTIDANQPRSFGRTIPFLFIK